MGQAEVTIDAKQRLQIPAKFRQQVEGAASPGPSTSTADGTTEPADGSAASSGTGDGPASGPATGWFCLPWSAGTTGAVLRLYPAAAFDQLVKELGGSVLQGPEDDDLETMLFGELERLEQDASGRVRLPLDQLELAGLPRDVTVVGAGSKLEVHDRARWQEAKRARFERLPQLVAARRKAAATDGG